MKIINKLTLRYLKENKKRTILTILCIAVSVTMISCVGIAFHSGKQFYKEYIEKTTGDYHYEFTTGNENIHKMMKFLEDDKEINEYYFSNTEFYYPDKNKKNTNQIRVKRGDLLYYQKRDCQNLLLEGRMPKNSNEIVVDKDYFDSKNISIKLGSQITLYKNNSDNEQKAYPFTIVGYIKKYEGGGYLNPSYEALSYIDFNDPDAWYTIYIQDKDVSTNIFEHAQKISEKIASEHSATYHTISYNSSYLAIQDIFEKDSHSAFIVIYNLVAVILVVIMIISYFIIYQAFNLSTNDRVQYLGMLSSVGATPKQKKRSVYFEGLILSLIGIPIGIAIAFIGLSMTFMFINQFNMLKETGVTIHAAISLKYLGIVIGLSLLTIFISLYIPARRISKISVIDALRKNDEIKVKKSKLKTNFIMRKFSNISWQLAMKNYKRQGRRSRVIVFSLVLSMISFISVFSFGNQMYKQADLSKQYKDYDIEMTLAGHKNLMNDLQQFLDHNDKVDDYYYDTQLYNCAAQIDKSYFNRPLDRTGFFVDEDQSILTTLIGLNQTQMKKVCEENNIEYKDNIGIIYDSGIYKKMDKDFISKLVLD